MNLWEVATGAPLSESLEHGEAVYSVAFSPDGKTLASGGSEGGSDGKVILWDLATRSRLGEALLHPMGVRTIAFSPDGKTFGSGGNDGNVILWDGLLWSRDIDLWRARLCEVVGRNLGLSEWEHLLPDQPYSRTCPQYPEGE